jgi:hypothetical protein
MSLLPSHHPRGKRVSGLHRPQQLSQLEERRSAGARRTKRHLCASRRVRHPSWNDADGPVQELGEEVLTTAAAVAVHHLQAPSVKRVPRVVDGARYLDMGIMKE